MKFWVPVAAVAIALALFVGWIREDRSGSKRADDSTPARTGQQPKRPEQKAGRKDPRAGFPPMACAPELTNCVVATGRVIYVEKVDPDGDGDAHFVTLSPENVTGGGLTVFDVRPDLRPDPLPGIGARVGGLGPVYPGSYGQKQIEVTEFHVAR